MKICYVILIALAPLGSAFAQDQKPQPTSPSANESAKQEQSKHGEAQQPTPPAQALAPAEPQPVSEKKSEESQKPEPLSAIVIEVGGSVDRAKAGVSALVDDGWTASKVGDRYESGTQIRTGLRSHVNLQFGQTTTVSVRSATYASIDQFYASAAVENVRIGLGYGTVRGGSSEGEIKSDVIVDSPVATLAKRGTEGWELEVEPMTGRFRVSLAEYGIVEAIQKTVDGRAAQSRTVLPSQYATQANIANMWVNQNIFNRNVTFYSPEAQTKSESEFATQNNRGLNVLAPGSGVDVVSSSQRVSAQSILNSANNNIPPNFLPANTAIGLRSPLGRPEGNFGTGTTFRAVAPAGRSGH